MIKWETINMINVIGKLYGFTKKHTMVSLTYGTVNNSSRSV